MVKSNYFWGHISVSEGVAYICYNMYPLSQILSPPTPIFACHYHIHIELLEMCMQIPISTSVVTTAENEPQEIINLTRGPKLSKYQSVL